MRTNRPPKTGGSVIACCLLLLTALECRAAVVQDDLGPMPDAKRFAHVAMSPDCRDIAMVVKTDNGVELRVNGKPAATADDITNLLYSPDSAHLAYTARRGAVWYLVLAGKETPLGPRTPSNLIFSSDSGHLLYVTAAPGGQALVVDGAVKKTYRQIAQLSVSPAGFHYAYAVSDDNSRWGVVHDDADTALDLNQA